MPLEIAKKIINEISSKEFSKTHKVRRIEIGENGDAFLNPDLIKILRYIKLKLPNIKVELLTNFQNFTREKSEIILKEKLIDSFGCNIDGFSESNYFSVKRLNIKDIQKNIHDFLDIRKQLNNKSPLRIAVITLTQYIKAIKDSFNFFPSKLENIDLKNIQDDFLLIKKEWRKILDSKTDKISRLPVFGWAERESVSQQPIDYKKYSCPNLTRVKEEAFISPAGDWYICCFDSKNALVLGNVTEESIDCIYNSQKRKEILKMLEERKFATIGGPCKTVNCCQYLYYDLFSKVSHEINKFIVLVKNLINLH